MNIVNDLYQSANSACYIIGKGDSLDSYIFDRNLPAIAINDSFLAYPNCDYAVGGEDINTKNIFNKYKDINSVSPQSYGGKYIYHGTSSMETAIKHDDRLFWGGRRSSFAAVWLALKLGYKELICVGIDCDKYSIRWNHLNTQRNPKHCGQEEVIYNLCDYFNASFELA